jgi:ATP-dependent Lon protease
MPKRPSRANARQRKCSEDNTDDPPPIKKPRYNLRRRTPDQTIWVNDDTLSSDDESDSEEEEPVTVTIEFHSNQSDDEEILQLLGSNKFSLGNYAPEVKRNTQKKPSEQIPIELNGIEKKYYQKLPLPQRKEMLDSMRRISNLMINEGEIPYKFKVLQMPVSDYTKSIVLKKLDALEEMAGDSGSSYKLRTWVDGFLRVPFGKSVPLPVSIDDGIEKCTSFMTDARKRMDTDIYGMNDAKTQIMQVLSQWISNPSAVGNAIVLCGSPGIGKTAFARNAIADVLRRPFSFFTLGGASDIANFNGHSYTYEGSTWGRIADSLMQAGVMNPVMYFDELDKISSTPHGEEIVSMLIHLTDRSQNTEFHDKYFAGIDFDMSQCLFVFSVNDIEKVHPILRDRMTVIHCGDYTVKDKLEILKRHILPTLTARVRLEVSDLIMDDVALTYIIEEYSKNEGGMRNIIRAVETMMTRINMLRLSNDKSMKDYPFYMDVQFPLTITPKTVRMLLKGTDKPKTDQSYLAMYT